MSKKSWFKKKVDLPETKTPRAMADINKEYVDTVSAAGQADFHIYAYTKQLEFHRMKLAELTNEAKAREALDKAAAAQTQGVTNE